MRIRKRQVPLPLSSLSPVPLSDPHLGLVQLRDYPLENLSPQGEKPDPNPTIGGGANTQMGPQGVAAEAAVEEAKDRNLLLSKKQERGDGGEEEDNDTREEISLSAQVETLLLLRQSSCSSHNQAVGRWGEGERSFPLKKRRGSFESKPKDELIMEKDKKMKTKMNKKCVQQQNGGDGYTAEGSTEAKERNADHVVGANTPKRRARGGALMEGSRCSRVNGRGWRCCQQTLVGYSLCEHHLGKGRLRSMSSVRSRSVKKTESNPSSSSSLIPPAEKETQAEARPILSNTDKADDNGEDGDYNEKEISMVGKKKMKLGVVKARSMSSLLGQASNEISAAEGSSN